MIKICDFTEVSHLIKVWDLIYGISLPRSCAAFCLALPVGTLPVGQRTIDSFCRGFSSDPVLVVTVLVRYYPFVLPFSTLPFVIR